MPIMLNTIDDLPKGTGKLCHEIPNGRYPIRLYQNRARKGSFAVQYGLQLDHLLTYSAACDKLGAAILHMLACDGAIDNERD
jgi:hypothetical protein